MTSNDLLSCASQCTLPPSLFHCVDKCPICGNTPPLCFCMTAKEITHD